MPGPCTSIPIACRDAAARSRRRMACWWRPMAARGGVRRPYAATMRRAPETGGRSRRRRDGLFAKENGGETTKLSGSSRDVHDYQDLVGGADRLVHAPMRSEERRVGG